MMAAMDDGGVDLEEPKLLVSGVSCHGRRLGELGGFGGGK